MRCCYQQFMTSLHYDRVFLADFFRSYCHWRKYIVITVIGFIVVVVVILSSIVVAVVVVTAQACTQHPFYDGKV